MTKQDFSIKQFKAGAQTKKIRRVAALTRVSTKHEQQMNALENQNKWLTDVMATHSDWIYDIERDLYVDNGVSGTSLKNRVAFKTMVRRAESGEYDLIVTREVSRFMRNLKLTLELVDELKQYGVEIYFVNDGIWTFNEEDYLKLTLMGSLAEQESRKISERVCAGQEQSRKNGVLYGNGNILGYDLIKGVRSEDNTYVINEEQADTVRRIYQLSLEGVGMKKIANIMEEEGRKTSSGKVKWCASTIQRILTNPTYCGEIEYLKSYTEDPITHLRVVQKDKSRRPRIKGKFEPIIPIEVWLAVQEGIKSRTNHTLGENTSGGINISKDIYCRKMRCECGRRMKKDIGRKDGMATYKCYSIIDNGSIKSREKRGLSTEGCCSLPGIIDWKLALYTKRVFECLSIQTEDIKAKVLKAVEECYTDEKSGVISQQKIDSLTNAIKKLEDRVGRLIDMRADGELSKEEYIRRKEEAEAKISEKKAQLQEVQEVEEDYQSKEECIKAVGVFLDKALHFDCYEVSDELIDTYVNSIKVYNDNTFEYNICLNPKSKSDRPEIDNDNYQPCNGDSLHVIDNSNAKVLAEFTIERDEAKVFANQRKRKVNRVHWQDAKIRIVADI